MTAEALLQQEYSIQGGDFVNAGESSCKIRNTLREIGIDISRNKPRALSLEMIEHADRMITMGCGADAGAVCPASFIKTEDWALDDPKGKQIEQIRNIRDEIKKRVMVLIEEIVSNQEV